MNFVPAKGQYGALRRASQLIPRPGMEEAGDIWTSQMWGGEEPHMLSPSSPRSSQKQNRHQIGPDPDRWTGRGQDKHEQGLTEVCPTGRTGCGHAHGRSRLWLDWRPSPNAETYGYPVGTSLEAMAKAKTKGEKAEADVKAEKYNAPKQRVRRRKLRVGEVATLRRPDCPAITG